MAHHPISQKEVDELLAKGAIKPSTAGSGFYLNIFIGPKCTGGLWPIFNHKWFKCYMHMPSFHIPTIRQVWQLTE